MSDEIAVFIRNYVPDDWFVAPVQVRVDREEVLVVGELPLAVDVGAFRDATRSHRVRIAESAEMQFLRKVSWGVRVGNVEHRFSTVSVPVMSRLRQDERIVLDSLIDGGLARTRSEALNWCVRLVGRNQREWLAELREAAASVERVRGKGPCLDD